MHPTSARPLDHRPDVRGSSRTTLQSYEDERDGSLEDEVQARLVVDLYHRAPAAIGAAVIMLPFLAAVIAPALEDALVWGLFLAFALLNIARLGWVLAVNRFWHWKLSAGLRHRIFAASTFGVGVSLAAVGVVAYPLLEPVDIALLAVCHCGILSGALMSLGASLVCYAAYVVPVLGASIVMLALDGRTWGADKLLVLVLIFFAALLVFGRQQWRARRSAVVLALELEQLALQDELTKLPNRRYLELAMEREQTRLFRAGSDDDDRALCLLVVDIDHFKRINDTHGHLIGDRVLTITGDVLQSSVRKTDVVCRWGGEEFVIALAEQGEEGPSIVADRIRGQLGEQELVVNGQIIRWSCSIGFASLPANVATTRGLGWKHALALADAALYRAKQDGRDRTAGVECSHALLDSFGSVADFARTIGEDPRSVELRTFA